MHTFVQFHVVGNLALARQPPVPFQRVKVGKLLGVSLS